MRCVFEGYFPHNKIVFSFVFCLLFSFKSFSRIRFNIDHTGRALRSYSLKEACEKKFRHKPLLSNVEDNRYLNCMGKVFRPNSLCKDEKVMDSLFTRSMISPDKKHVVCEFATHVKINLQCDHPLIAKSCESAQEGCRVLQKNYATNLKIIHSSIIKEQDDIKILDCHFSNTVF